MLRPVLGEGSRARKRTIAFAVLQVLVIWAIAAGTVWATYDEDVESGQTSAQNMSLTVSAYARQTLGSADLAMRSVQDWVTETGVDSDPEFRRIASDPRFSTALHDRIVAMPHVSVAVIASANGDVINTTSLSEEAPGNISDREAFRMLASGGAPEVALTSLMRGPSGRWTFFMARRLVANSGTMLGIVVVGLDAQSFSGLFRQIAPVGEEAITLFRPDGALLATTVSNPSAFGNRYPDAAALQMVRQGLDGTVQFTRQPKWSDPGNAEPRLIAPRQVQGFPVVVAVSIGQSVYLAGWHSELLLSIGIALALTVLTALVAWKFLELLKRTEATGRLEAERRLLATLVDTPSALCAVLDRDGRVVYSNGRFADVMAGSFVTSSAFGHPDVRGGEDVLRFAASDDTGPVELDIRLELDREHPRYLRFSLSRQALPGLGECTVMIGHDETVRHEAQKSLAQSAQLETLGELTTGMAHEIAQPLNVMRIAAQNALMEIEATDGAAHDVAEFRSFMTAKLNRIVSQIDRAADIVSRMRIFGRAPNGPPSAFDMRDACRSVISLVEGRLSEAGVAIRADLGSEPMRVRGYRNQLELVLLNLLLNARDALEAASDSNRVIDIGTRSRDGRIRLVVSDNGPGIAPNIRDRIFEPFFSGKPEGKGAGLGLATSYGIVRDAGGELTLLSSARGAAFQIELPAA